MGAWSYVGVEARYTSVFRTCRLHSGSAVCAQTRSSLKGGKGAMSSQEMKVSESLVSRLSYSSMELLAGGVLALSSRGEGH